MDQAIPGQLNDRLHTLFDRFTKMKTLLEQSREKNEQLAEKNRDLEYQLQQVIQERDDLRTRVGSYESATQEAMQKIDNILDEIDHQEV